MNSPSSKLRDVSGTRGEAGGWERAFEKTLRPGKELIERLSMTLTADGKDNF